MRTAAPAITPSSWNVRTELSTLVLTNSQITRNERPLKIGENYRPPFPVINLAIAENKAKAVVDERR